MSVSVAEAARVIAGALALGVPLAVVIGHGLARVWAGEAPPRRAMGLSAGLSGTLALAGLIGAPLVASTLDPSWYEAGLWGTGRAEVADTVLRGGWTGAALCGLLTLVFVLGAVASRPWSYGPAPRLRPSQVIAALAPAVGLVGALALAALPLARFASRSLDTRPIPPPLSAPHASAPHTSAPQRSVHPLDTLPGLAPGQNPPPVPLPAAHAAVAQLAAQALAIVGPVGDLTPDQLAEAAQRLPDQTRTEPCAGGTRIERSILFTGNDVVGRAQAAQRDLIAAGYREEAALGSRAYRPPAPGPIERVAIGSRQDNTGYVRITSVCSMG